MKNVTGNNARGKRRPGRHMGPSVGRMALLSPIRRLSASDVLAVLAIAGFNAWAWLSIAGLY